MILLDTTVLVDLAFPESEQVSASILSRAELELGIRVAPDAATAARRTARLAVLDAMLEWLPFTEADSRAYGVIGAAVHARAAAQARRTDTFLAAQAYARGAGLMTANVQDFKHVSHLVRVLPQVAPAPTESPAGAEL
ncbi:MAG: hypothetical protein LBD77_07260 [Bifidobacteriaceae bacterium]|nr:hypothetical protein [Bifidobacteriaceae bacterium]